MLTEPRKPAIRTCPHCGKIIPRLPTKPRDLGLLLHWLVYTVPCEKPMNELLIEGARKHCRMTPERLAVLRLVPHDRHWRRMDERRAARLLHFKIHGTLPQPGIPLIPGEASRFHQINAFRRYRKGGLAKLKARLRKHPDTANLKLANRYLATKRIKCPSRKLAAIDDCLARLLANYNAGKMSLAEFEALKGGMLPE
jgi:hypothetical protein